MDKHRVLVVDDSAVMRQLISDLLERSGKFIVADTAANGLEALQKVDSLSPDLITMDIEMPVMDGLTALRRIMETDSLPVIVLSTHTDEGSTFAIDALELGAVDFYHKDDLFRLPRNPQTETEFLLRCQAALLSRPVRRMETATVSGASIIQGLLGFIAGMLQQNVLNDVMIAHWRNTVGTKGLYVRLRMEGGHIQVIEAEGKMLRLFGWAEQSIQDVAIDTLLPDEIAREWKACCEQAWNGEETARCHVEWRTCAITTAFRSIKKDGEAVELIALSVDTSEQKRTEERMSDLANVDLLTGLPNRSNLMKQLTRMTQEQDRFAVFSIQIERLKLASDMLGQEIGDRLLLLVARRLKSYGVGGVQLYRTGSHQFVCVLSDAGREQAVVFAEQIGSAIRRPFHIARHEVHLFASIGVSLYPDDHEIAEHLIRCADIARDCAEKQGEGTLEFYDPRYQAEIHRRMDIEMYLRRALERDEFVLLYQPEMDLASNEIKGFECLIRWDSPELGRISPAEFIPVAEETGLIYRLGEWVLREACRQNRAWQDAGLPKLFVAVNLSSRQFYDHKLPEKIANILQTSRLDPSCLELEITESMTMNLDSAAPTLHALRNLGLTVAIDDFGTGYSSLAYLKRLPADKLKIDKSFVSEMTKSAADASIVNAIIAITKELNLLVTAEGVETEEELQLLRLLKCDIAQGYLLSRPIEASQVPLFLQRFRGSIASSID